MNRKGANVLMRPKPRDTVRASGVIIPDVVENTDKEWGVVVEGHGEVETGSRALYYRKNCFEKDGLKIVDIKKLLYWELC